MTEREDVVYRLLDQGVMRLSEAARLLGVPRQAVRWRARALRINAPRAREAYLRRLVDAVLERRGPIEAREA